MKHISKLIGCFLLCALLISSAGCGTDSASKPSEDKEPTMDMSGYDFLLLIESDSEDTLFSYRETTALYDKMLERFRQIEDKYGCTMSFDYTPTSVSPSIVMNKVLAGQRLADLFDSFANNNPAIFARAGILIPIPDLSDYLDYENETKFGSVALLECAMAESVPYAVFPTSLPQRMGSGSFLIAFNRDLIHEYDLPDPHEYYESKSWTFDKLNEIVGNWYMGPDSNPRYVLSGASRAFVELSLLNNGVRFVTEENGELVTDIYSSASVNALEWLKQFYNVNSGNGLNLLPDTSYWDSYTFTSGNTFMQLASGDAVMMGPYQYDCDYKFGLMPFPSGPDAVYGQFSTYLEAGATYCFPISCDWPEAAAMITSDLFEPLDGYGEDGDLTSFYLTNYFLDEIDTEIYMHHLDYARYTYWNFDGLKLSSDIASNINSSTPQVMLEKFGGTFDKCVEEEIKGNFEYLNTHMYNR